MSNNEIREELARLLAASSGSGGEPPRIASPLPTAEPDRMARGEDRALGEQLALLTRQVEGLRAGSVSTGTDGGAGGRSIFDNVKERASSARNPFRLGSVVSPVITGLVRLFRRRNEDAPAPLPVFRLPQSVNVDAGFSRIDGRGLGALGSGADGLRRLVSAPAPPQQVTINVQAMDSRSFLDHSGDIARAVREAMLNTHAINDVVNDL
jgi:hypothetical protein